MQEIEQEKQATEHVARFFQTIDFINATARKA